ncbi:glycosyltransferase [Shimia abyssi]|uniref:Type II secretion system protein GspE N-terminal domain-containing protein n=1 Tax=Shimia abyssi TaxID=1662395 RepID=A0A2P8FB03_9RHOB|nr:glycosyltransferase [Shimia abyssi]PSL18868.1 hypothetical protein CLV88_10846 [Shimia abyssi]
MNDPVLRISQAEAVPQPDVPVDLGRALIERNLITPWQLFYALRCKRSWDATLPEILLSRGWISAEDLSRALCQQYSARPIDLQLDPPNPTLINLLSPEFCLKHSILPWARVSDMFVLVTARPERMETVRPALPPEMRDALIVVASEDQLRDYITNTCKPHLTKMAETRVDQVFSCRGWDRRNHTRTICVILLTLSLLLAGIFAPMSLLAALMVWALLSLFVATLMKGTAFVLHLLHRHDPPTPPMPPNSRLPRISVLVPLYRETEIAQALIRRLTRLTYPRALLDVVLVLEEKDTLTRQTVAETRLPKWMRVIKVPSGSGLTTKPRALNYALDYCKGDIIGIWDAEDAPARDQLEQVARHFAHADPNVACVQGVLDYYNPYTNWLSRCFTIEYSTWFRIVLPGLARLGLAIPLGGTTLFLRRAAIEHVGGWDAHNVTEDADLGYRLARFGYRTELMRTVTQEEANCHPIAWVRQRSRWLKGFMVTYLVHMRRPRQLWRDLGPRKFIGFHMVFMTTLTQFVLAPLIWSFWGAAFGLQHPLTNHVGPHAIAIAGFLLICAGILSSAIALTSVMGQGRERLYPWVLTMTLYFPLATVAAYKALIELLVAPYYWDKPAHGKTAEATETAPSTPETNRLS